ncbi:MAG: hypothetical protein KDD36_13790, partial [Flavobacteriales bacterium]|nr:hypothetical protein [Flavobacteriales bacterium]
MIRKCRWICILTCICMWMGLARAQTYNFRNYSVKEGLPFIHVFEIYQDHLGYLWTGGYGGMSRFNGTEFRNFSEKDGLSSHWVTCITEDAKGDLWIGTVDGLNRSVYSTYANEPLNLTSYNEKDGLPSGNITALVCDDRGRLWVGTSRGMGVWRDSIFVSLPSPLGNSHIHRILQGPGHTLWVSSSAGL